MRYLFSIKIDYPKMETVEPNLFTADEIDASHPNPKLLDGLTGIRGDMTIMIQKQT